jgi:hypothetical protein
MCSNAGKTTILQQMKNQLQLSGEDINTIPTIGCNEDHVSHNKVKLKVIDMGGKESVHPFVHSLSYSHSFPFHNITKNNRVILPSL